MDETPFVKTYRDVDYPKVYDIHNFHACLIAMHIGSVVTEKKVKVLSPYKLQHYVIRAKKTSRYFWYFFVLNLLNYVAGVIEETYILVDEHLPDDNSKQNRMQ